MKKILALILFLGIFTEIALADACSKILTGPFVPSQAIALCTKLGNSVAISQIPQSTNTVDLGSASLVWRNAYIGTQLNMTTAASAMVIGAANAETVAAAGTTTADAGVLTNVAWHRVTGANGTVGVRLSPTSGLAVGVIHYVISTTAGVLKIYPPTGGTINGGSADASISTVSGLTSTICRLTGSAAWDCA